jgi:hypothetical protein
MWLGNAGYWVPVAGYQPACRQAGFQDLNFDHSKVIRVLRIFCLATGNRNPVTDFFICYSSLSRWFHYYHRKLTKNHRGPGPVRWDGISLFPLDRRR